MKIFEPIPRSLSKSFPPPATREWKRLILAPDCVSTYAHMLRKRSVILFTTSTTKELLRKSSLWFVDLDDANLQHKTLLRLNE